MFRLLQGDSIAIIYAFNTGSQILSGQSSTPFVITTSGTVL